ncbi:MAG TPA: hypothetical protein VKE69_00685 [Planctomycetota bacterium]|nr:hypothetical protein [Planctomycetota bacterium]
MRFDRLFVLCLASSVLLASCSSPEVSYEDPERPAVVENRFSMNDLTTVARDSVQKLIKDENTEGTTRPMVFMAGLKNDTSEHIDMQSVADAIRAALLDSQKFRFTAGSQGAKEIDDQLSYQAVVASPESAAKAGRAIGAKYILYGRLSEFAQQSDSSKLKDYQFVINMVNVETREVLSSGLTRIRKVTTNAKVGW